MTTRHSAENTHAACRKHDAAHRNSLISTGTYLSHQTLQVDTTGMSITGGRVDLLSRLMDASLKRHEVVGANVANVNTPGYRRSEVRFEDELAEAIRGGEKIDAERLDKIRIVVGQTPGLEDREDGNNVNIDQELGELSKNSLLFETYTQLLATQLGMMNSAISGRT